MSQVISMSDVLRRRARKEHPNYIRRFLAYARMREMELTSQGRCAHCEEPAGRDAVSVPADGIFGDRLYCRSCWESLAE